jgi:hypothetical protein
MILYLRALLQSETKAIIDLLHQMADKGLLLDSEIISTILTCLCDMSKDIDVMEILPNFSQEASKGARISCECFYQN